MHTDLARRILEHEAGDASDPAAALERVCQRLKDHLVVLLGSNGVTALFRRALHLAQRERPLLAGVAVSSEPDACFTGLAESLAASTADVATSAAATILAHTLELLVMLLGEELGMKPVRKLWPGASRVTEIDE